MARQPIFYVYRHVREDLNTPFYIGRGKGKNDTDYSRAFCMNLRSHSWRQVYNQSSIKIDILYETDNEQESYDKEIEFIKLYGRVGYDQFGVLCNASSGGKWGGSGVLPSADLVEKRAKRLRGVPKSKEHIKNASTARKISIEKMEVSPFGKEIFQYTLDGVFIKKWDNIKSANRFLGYKSATIDNKLMTGINHARGYLWYRDFKGEKFNPNPTKLFFNKVVQAEMDGNIIGIFDTVESCVEYNKGNTNWRNQVPNTCKGKRDSYCGYKFIFEVDLLQKGIKPVIGEKISI